MHSDIHDLTAWHLDVTNVPSGHLADQNCRSGLERNLLVEEWLENNDFVLRLKEAEEDA